MKRIFFINLFVLFLSSAIYSQCLTTDEPLIDAIYMGSLVSYIDVLEVDGNSISSGTGFQASGNSYQYFNTPVIQLRIGSTSVFNIYGDSDGQFNMAVWIDFNGDNIFSGSENVGYVMNSSYYMVELYVFTPETAVNDTVKLRIVKQIDSGGWGTGENDACNIVTAGEIEEYLAIISCNYSENIPSYDPYPAMCNTNPIELSAFGMFGDIQWFADTNSAPVYTGTQFMLYAGSSVTDTVIYIRNVYGYCTDGPFYPINVTVLQLPQIEIDCPDTMQSCGPYTFNATAGFDYYNWGTGDATPQITISESYSGVLWVNGIYNNGCESWDVVNVSIATEQPSFYATTSEGPDFCNSYMFFLNYDSLTLPGTCTWYSLPSNSLVGTGAEILIDWGAFDSLQFMACINSACGIDTAYVTQIHSGVPSWDSIYVYGSSAGAGGIYNACYNGNSVQVILAGSDGQIVSISGADTTNYLWYTLPWNSGNVVSLPSFMLSPGIVYAVFATVSNTSGCEINTDTIFLQLSGTLGYSLPDTTFMCNFPGNIGIPAVDYQVYDVLWNTGDTTNTLYITMEGNYSVTTYDNSTGCYNSAGTYVVDGSNAFGAFVNVTYVCGNDAYFNPDYLGFQPDYWAEYSNTWDLLNESYDIDYYISYQGFNEYLVVEGYNSLGCFVTDTTYVNFNGNFSFSLGNDVSVTQSSYTINGPLGYPYYSWSPGGETTSSVTVTSTGVYTLTIDNGQGCVYSDAIMVTLLPMGVTDKVSDSGVSVFPNPANSEITVLSAGNEISDINIFDITGRSQRISIIKYNGMVKVNISEIPCGYYFIEIGFKNGFPVKESVIIER